MKKGNFFIYYKIFNNFISPTFIRVITGIIIDWIFIEKRKVKRIFLREKGNSVQLRYEITITTTRIKKDA